YTLTDTTPSQGSYDTNTGVWTIGTIANQATVTLVIEATINASGEYTNLAEVTASDNFDPDSTPDNGVDTDNDGNVENDPDDEDDGDGEEPGEDGVQPVSDISLDKTSEVTLDADNSGTPTPNDTVVFTVSVTNNGPNEATSVAVTDELPDGYTMLGNTASQGSYDVNTGVWTIGTIANQATVTLVIEATINASGEYTNLAEVTASDNFDPDSTPDNGVDTDNDGNVENDPDDEDDGDGEEPGEDGVQPVSDISLDKTSEVTLDADNSGTPTPNDTVVFTISVNNNGPNEAPGVVVTDQIPTGYTLTNNTPSQGSYDVNTGVWTIGTIANQATVTLVIEATINASGEYTNLAEVTASDNFDPDSTPNNGVDTDGDGNVENDPDDEDDGDGEEPGEEGVQPVSDISLNKKVVLITDADGSGGPTPFDTVEFEITVTNSGPNKATGIVIKDELPAGYTMVNSNTTTGTVYFDTEWTIPTLNINESVVLTLLATINPDGPFTNFAEVIASDNFDPDSTPNNGILSEDDHDSADPKVKFVSDLRLVMTTNKEVADVGETVVYNLELTNDGPNRSTNVRVKSLLPSGLEYIIHRNGNYNLQDGIWEIGDIEVDETKTLEIDVTVLTPQLLDNEHFVEAEVTRSINFDPNSTPNNGVVTEDDYDSFQLRLPIDLRITKTVDDANPIVNHEIMFTISVTNPTVMEATGVIVEDLLPEGYIYVSHTTDVPGSTYNDMSGEWNIGTVPGNTTVTLLLTVQVNEFADYPSGDYINTTTIIGVDQEDFVNVNNTATAETKPVCLTVYNIFSPNGDGVNDYFKIDCLDKYPNNKLQVYGRWGRLVFKAENYDNKWTGISNGGSVVGRNKGLPDGTYMYIIDLGDGSPLKKGWLTISRGQ
ncbi:gliding motility-associated C-terminal domain-containing protein, partial [Tenacibaculum sp. 1_MG-2023]|uniref:T9SS type B sorting domain-containing protein n=1 Tax=Tenacibaculum sp. 1_MG-2023 TaxID=3062653 RepID=UPI0026E3B066